MRFPNLPIPPIPANTISCSCIFSYHIAPLNLLVDTSISRDGELGDTAAPCIMAYASAPLTISPFHLQFTLKVDLPPLLFSKTISVTPSTSGSPILTTCTSPLVSPSKPLQVSQESLMLLLN